ncbi:MAG: FmdB family zinc ribbon protein [bacterium]
MPIYEYSCKSCGYKFDIVASLAEKEAGLMVVCPKCGGRNVHQIFGRFTVIGSSKSLGDFDEGVESGSDYGEDLSDFDDEFGDYYNNDEDVGENEAGEVE